MRLPKIVLLLVGIINGQKSYFYCIFRGRIERNAKKARSVDGESGLWYIIGVGLGIFERRMRRARTRQ
jgi:hypothetical protein